MVTSRSGGGVIGSGTASRHVDVVPRSLRWFLSILHTLPRRLPLFSPLRPISLVNTGRWDGRTQWRRVCDIARVEC